MKTFVAVLIVMSVVGCGKSPLSTSEVASTSAPTPSMANPATLARDYVLRDGHELCPAGLRIKDESNANGLALTLLRLEDSGDVVGALDQYYAIGKDEGVYTFNSSNSLWTWKQALVSGNSMIMKEAQSYFIRPIFPGREVARMTLDAETLTVKRRMWSDEAQEAVSVSCEFSL